LVNVLPHDYGGAVIETLKAFMPDTADIDTLLIALVGGATVAAVLINSLCSRLKVPALVGYLVLGIVIGGLDDVFAFMTTPVEGAFRFLANLGIVALLFAVGLESHPRALAKKLPAAMVVWLSNVAVAGGLGFFAAYWVLSLGLVPSLLVATALTGTSVGVSVGAWREVDALESPDGELLLDVAELDDISAIGLMALLFALAPVLAAGDGGVIGVVSQETVTFLAKLAILVASLVLFAHYVERHITDFVSTLRLPPQRMLVVAGVGFLIAAAAGGFGFSLAVGAMFAGLVFSGDPEAVKTETSFHDLSAFVTPFFFIGIGLHVDLTASAEVLWLVIVLLVAAVAGKLVGTFVPALVATSASGAVLVAVSMVPRAEIAMVVVDQGRLVLPAMITPELYAAMVLVAGVTCVGAPLVAKKLLLRRR
jgi:Kef-type K+ transport system membrane component KefB